MFRKKIKSPPSPFQLSEISFLKNAYAHNDQQFNYPLLDALKLGISYIEVDIHLIKNEIYVSHRRPLLPIKNNTLTKRYLHPLFQLFQQINTHQNYFLDTPLHLFLDIKTNGKKTYHALEKQLQPYLSIFEKTAKNKTHPFAKIILTGNKPMENILAEKNQLVSLDGRINDLKDNYPQEIMPIISANYNKLFGYSLFSNHLSDKKINLLREIADEVHSQNKLFRLWNIPEKETVWEKLLQNGVDLISTDNINKLSTFLKNQ